MHCWSFKANSVCAQFFWSRSLIYMSIPFCYLILHFIIFFSTFMGFSNQSQVSFRRDVPASPQADCTWLPVSMWLAVCPYWRMAWDLLDKWNTGQKICLRCGNVRDHHGVLLHLFPSAWDKVCSSSQVVGWEGTRTYLQSLARSLIWMRNRPLLPGPEMGSLLPGRSLG